MLVRSIQGWARGGNCTSAFWVDFPPGNGGKHIGVGCFGVSLTEGTSIMQHYQHLHPELEHCRLFLSALVFPSRPPSTSCQSAFFWKWVHYLATATMLVSIFTLVAMSVDRYIAVVHAKHSPCIHSKRNAVLGVGVNWLLSLLIAIPVAQHQALMSGHHKHPTAPSGGPSRCTKSPSCWWDTSCLWCSSPAAMPRWVKGTWIMFKLKDRSLLGSWWLSFAQSSYPANR